jgi:hypothetical protein
MNIDSDMQTNTELCNDTDEHMDINHADYVLTNQKYNYNIESKEAEVLQMIRMTDEV